MRKEVARLSQRRFARLNLTNVAMAVRRLSHMRRTRSVPRRDGAQQGMYSGELDDASTER